MISFFPVNGSLDIFIIIDIFVSKKQFLFLIFCGQVSLMGVAHSVASEKLAIGRAFLSIS